MEGASMLVLSRQRDETIMIGDDIEVTVVDIRGDKVRLGINAPQRDQRPSQGSLRRHPAREPRRGPGETRGPFGLGKVGPKTEGPNQGQRRNVRLRHSGLPIARFELIAYRQSKSNLNCRLDGGTASPGA
jgi:carbon storage regulator